MYRQWLKDNNINITDDIDNYNPPRKRPDGGEKLEDWIYWRMFSTEAMSKFINTSADIAKKVNTNISSLTCMTPNMLEYDNFIRG